MNLRPLGRTGLMVSEIALGTVELGMDYGFRGSAAWDRPAEDDAVRLLHAGVEAGINLIDTARAYGESERIVGRALAEMRERPYIASKVAIEAGTSLAAVRESVETSLRMLGVDVIDLLQIHHTTQAVLERPEVFRCLEDLRREGKVRFLGASFYEEPVAWAALDNPSVECLQVAFNLLDRKMAARVLPGAQERGAGVLARSAFLRGVLTPQIAGIPAELAPLKERALAAMAAIRDPVERIAEIALRYCLSEPGVSAVLIGVRSREELDVNLAAAARGALPAAVMDELRRFAMADGDPMLNPGNWQGLI